MLKIIYLDCETTGLSPSRDSIHQLSGMIEINGEVVNQFDIKMKPFNIFELPDTYVTPVGGITKQMMLGPEYVTQQEGFGYFKTALSQQVDKYDKQDKYHICGYNCQSFDMNFPRHFFEKNEDTYFGSWFYSASLDVMVIAANALRHERHKMANFKLSTVAKHLGFEVGAEGYHDAMGDIRVTRDIFKSFDLL